MRCTARPLFGSRSAAFIALMLCAGLFSACTSGKGTESACDEAIHVYTFSNYDTVKADGNLFPAAWITARLGDSLDVTSRVLGPSLSHRYTFPYAGPDAGFLTVTAWRDSSTRAQFDIEVSPPSGGCGSAGTFGHSVVWTGMTGHGGLYEVVVTREEE